MSPHIEYCADGELIRHMQQSLDFPFIYYHPGGNWGSLYPNPTGAHKTRLHVLEMAYVNNLTIITGPQTIYYSDEGKAMPDSAILNRFSSSNITLTWRQHDSYEFALKNYPHVKNLEIPDMVFQLDVVSSTISAEVDVAILLRTDQESTVGTISAEILCDEFRLRNISCMTISWLSPSVYPLSVNNGIREYLDSVLLQATGVVSKGRVVISDRLHGAVVSYLSGRGVVYLENKSRKTQGVLSTAFSGLSTNCSLDSDSSILPASNDVSDIVNKTITVLKHVKWTE